MVLVPQVPLSENVVSRRTRTLAFRENTPFEVFGMIGSEVCGMDYRIDRHSFPFLVFEFVESGSIHLRFDGLEHCLKAGGFFCYGPENRVEMEVDQLQGCHKHFLAFQSRTAETLGEFDYWNSSQARRQILQLPVVRTIKFLNLIREFSGKVGDWEVLRAVLRSFFLYLDQSTTVPSTEVSETDRSIDLIQRYMSNHFREIESLEQIAKQTGYDKSYLCQLYKKEGLISPYQQLLRMKIEFACVLLETTGLQVKEVAEAVGLHDPLHFSRLFRSRVGTSPSVYREMSASAVEVEPK